MVWPVGTGKRHLVWIKHIKAKDVDVSGVVWPIILESSCMCDVVMYATISA